MVNITIYFYYGGEWLDNLESHYDKNWINYWRAYDPDLIYFIDLINKFIDKLDFASVQQLIVLGLFVKYFEIVGDERVNTLSSFISEDYKTICLFATDDCEFVVDIPDIVIHDGSFLLVLIVNQGTKCSESESNYNNKMMFSCIDYDYDTDKLKYNW